MLLVISLCNLYVLCGEGVLGDGIQHFGGVGVGGGGHASLKHLIWRLCYNKSCYNKALVQWILIGLLHKQSGLFLHCSKLQVLVPAGFLKICGCAKCPLLCIGST